MAQQADSTGSNGTAVLVSVIAAGGAALAGAAFLGRQSKQERAQEQVDQQVAQLQAMADRASVQLTQALDGLSFNREATTRNAKKQVKKLTKSSSKTVDDAVKAANEHLATLEQQVDTLKLREQARGLASQGSDRVTSLSANLGDQLNSLVEEARRRTAEASASAGDSSADARAKAEKAVRKAAKRASTDLDQAKDEAGRLAGDLKARGGGLASAGNAAISEAVRKSPDLIDKAGKAAGDARQHVPELRESLSHLAETVAERGGEAVQKAREQVPELAAKARERRPDLVDSFSASVSAKSNEVKAQAKPLIAEVSSAATDAADHLVASARDARKQLGPDVQSHASNLGDMVSTSTHAIGEQSKGAATAAGRGAKETGALLMWSAAAGTVVYVALLNDEQRQRVKESGQRVLAEMKDLLADIRGYDDEAFS